MANDRKIAAIKNADAAELAGTDDHDRLLAAEKHARAALAADPNWLDDVPGPEPEPEPEPEPAPPSVPDPKRPPETAAVGVWRSYAVALGMDPEAASAASKADLIAAHPKPEPETPEVPDPGIETR